MAKTKKIVLSQFCAECLNEGVTHAAEIKAAFEEKYPNAKQPTLDAFVKSLKRMGATKELREQKAIEIQKKQNLGINILDMKEVIDYFTQSKSSHITQAQVERTKRSIVTVWELMEKTDPHKWDYTTLINAIATKYPYKVNDAGSYTFEKQGAVRILLSAVNTLFPNILKKGWYTGFTREAGVLKDYFTFAEMEIYDKTLTATSDLSLMGWQALFDTQLNLGCREGIKGFNGILGLMWEDINFSEKTCSLHEKGGRGKAGRLWQNLPLDMFPWLSGFEKLCKYHYEQYGYEPTNNQHAEGRVFPISYKSYRLQFHKTRKACNGRISGTKETFVPHIFRKTHAQWLVKLWVPLQDICGQFPNGYYGVGWDNPAILLKYYVTLEDEARQKSQIQAHNRMITLGLIEGEKQKSELELQNEKLQETVNELLSRINQGFGQIGTVKL